MHQFFKKALKAVATVTLSAGAGTALAASFIDPSASPEAKANIAMGATIIINPLLNYFANSESGINFYLCFQICFNLAGGIIPFIYMTAFSNEKLTTIGSASIIATTSSLTWEGATAVIQRMNQRLPPAQNDHAQRLLH